MQFSSDSFILINVVQAVGYKLPIDCLKSSDFVHELCN